MTQRNLVRLLVAQTVLMVVFGWAAIYLGRDEYQLAVGRDAEDLPSPSLLAEAQSGQLPEVRLNATAQRHAGLELQLPEATTMSSGTSNIALTVLDPQPLAELRGRLQAALQEVAAGRATAAASRLEQARVQALFDDDHNASQRTLETTSAQAQTDAARERSAQAQLTALRDGARVLWGKVVVGWLDAADGAALQRVLSGREVLLRAVLRADDSHLAPALLELTPPGRNEAVAARGLGTIAPGASGSAAAETTAGGRHLLFVAPGAGLDIGMRLTARRHDGHADGAVPGGWVPASAVIWHAGQAWIYVREAHGDAGESADTDKEAAVPPHPAEMASSGAAPESDRIDSFQRRGMPHAVRVGDRWFVPALETDDPVVVRGAQLLLSEELKSQIKNENDD